MYYLYVGRLGNAELVAKPDLLVVFGAWSTFSACKTYNRRFRLLFY